MEIKLLPQASIRAIGSSQVLVDPAAVVKELLDNALDAGATSIAIEVSGNTLDVIQVKDDGHGIAQSDRPMVARRYCTSKIRSATDLASVGGSSLGFRGEALASAAEMSGSLTITTRVKDEVTATTLHIDRQGEVHTYSKASAPVGTIVKITEFLKANPVRKQVALKATDVCIKKIRRTLQNYAFARPQVRLSLRILRAKTERADFLYAPKVDGDVKDAAMKIVGAACAAQCTWAACEQGGFHVRAFLPKAGANLEIISSHGSFISIDARPMANHRGIGKQITKLFKEEMKSSFTHSGDIKDPFLYIDIKCPGSSYDVNVEPGKDDVLFEDSRIVIGAVKQLFASVYATSLSDSTDEQGNREGQISSDAPIEDESSDMLDATFEQGTVHQSTDNVQSSDDAIATSEPASHASVVTCYSNMYGGDDDGLGLDASRSLMSREKLCTEVQQEFSNDPRLNNPWLTAKLNAPLKRSSYNYDSRNPRSQAALEARSSSPVTIVTKTTALPTPRQSSPLGSGAYFDPADHVPRIRLRRDGRVIGALGTPTEDYGQRLAEMRDEISNNSSTLEASLNLEQSQGVTATRTQQSGGTALADIPDINTRPRPKAGKPAQNRTNFKPFVSPVIDRPAKEKVWFDHLEAFEQQTPSYKKRKRGEANSSHGLVVQGEDMHGSFLSTPSSRNRDIREFVRPAAPASSPLEKPDNARYSLGVSEDNPFSSGAIETEIHERPRGALPRFNNGSGFTPINAFSSRPQQNATRNTNRPVNSLRPILADLDPYALTTPLQNSATGVEQNLYQITKSAPPTHPLHRRRSTSRKLTRSSSTRLPLETTPPNHRMHNLVYHHPSPLTPSHTRLTNFDIILPFHEPSAPHSLCDLSTKSIETFALHLHTILLGKSHAVSLPHTNTTEQAGFNLPPPEVVQRALQQSLRHAFASPSELLAQT